MSLSASSNTRLASPTTRHFMPWLGIPQLRSRQTSDFGMGNMTTFKRFVDVAAQAGIRAICLLPLTETLKGDASQFGRTSNNALSRRLIDLSEIDEVKNNKPLRDSLALKLNQASLFTQGPGVRRTDIALAEMMSNEFLPTAFEVFYKQAATSARKLEFGKFIREHDWWLTPYAYFNALKDTLSANDFWRDEANPVFDLKSSEAATLLKEPKFRKQVAYYQYVQMEVYRQVRSGLAYAKANGIEEIEGLIGVGVSLDSAEAFMMPDYFDRSRQIGCFPEPKNGYPLQLWGFAAERPGPKLNEFLRKSFLNMQSLGIDRVGIDHAAGRLGGYTTFPVRDSEGRPLNGDNLNDQKIAHAGGRWDIDIKADREAEREQHADEVLQTILDGVPGMKLGAETLGDEYRRSAAEKAILKRIEMGDPITLMHSLHDEKTPLNGYSDHDRLSVTHDHPALTALLTGRIGSEQREWIGPIFVSQFLNRLGVLAFPSQTPLKATDENFQLTGEFMAEIIRRIIGGSTAGTVALPLAALFNLNPAHLNTGLWQTTNIMPGKPAYVCNPETNWEQRLPAVEDLEPVLTLIQSVSDTTHRPFGVVVPLAELDKKPGERSNFEALVAGVKANSIAYQALREDKEGNLVDGPWTVWEAPEGMTPVLEIAVYYSGNHKLGGYEDKEWTVLNLANQTIDPNGRYILHDVVTDNSQSYDGNVLNQKVLPVGMNTTLRRHHFVLLKSN